MDSKSLALIATILLAASSIDSLSQQNGFETYKADQGRQYSSEVEEQYRQAIFNANVEKINAHNADETQTYKMGINQFSDWTQEEFESILLRPRTDVPQAEESDNEPIVGSVDWVSRGAVTGVKNQGSCGSCWAFSAIGALESAKWHKQGSRGSFSEQQAVSCDTSNSGCSGGLNWKAITYYANNGICTSSSYPYTGNNASCRISSCSKDSFNTSGVQRVSGTSSLTSAVNSRVMAVAVEARNWSSYSSGVFSNCGSSLDHDVVLTGYTSSYWMIKNSWGTGWGESGYIRLASGNTCGIANDASYPRI